MQKARRHPKAPTVCKHTVSGSLSLLYSRFFSPFLHSTRSLSVFEEYLALPDGSGKFRQDFTCPALLRILLGKQRISYTGLSPSLAQLSNWFYYTLLVHIVVLQPRFCRNKIGLGQFQFARHYYGNHFCFLFLRLLRCFSSARQPPCGCTDFIGTGCPIRKSTDHKIFASPRGLSQLITSFFASQIQGIPCVPLVTYQSLLYSFYYFNQFQYFKELFCFNQSFML